MQQSVPASRNTLEDSETEILHEASVLGEKKKINFTIIDTTQTRPRQESMLATSNQENPLLEKT